MSRTQNRAAVFGFGAPLLDQALFTDHREGQGWQPAVLLARAAGDLPLGSAAVQYGFSCFEGMKAFRGPDGGVHLFRADAHAGRLRASCERLCLPVVAEADFVRLVAEYVRAGEPHVPAHAAGALYLRPTLAACEEFLGMRAARVHRFGILATPMPVPSGKPLQLWVERELVRAAPGGIGAAKTGGNYAASLLGAERARARGLDQVIWLDAIERRFLAEAGVMNLFVVLGDEVVTPPLDGTILAGVTRASCLTLLREWGIPAQERPVAIEEVVAARAAGRLREAFGTGTAACIAPIVRMTGDGEDVVMEPGPLATRLRSALLAIQDGSADDPFGWRQPVTALR